MQNRFKIKRKKVEVKICGFTLIEMIGVMLILGLLIIFIMPSVINYVKKGDDAKEKITEQMIYDATKKYINDNRNIYKVDNKNTYCIDLNTLVYEGYLDSDMTSLTNATESSPKSVKITYDEKYKYEITNECVGIVNPTPILYKGLTPVYYNEENSNWVVADIKTDEWYDYDNQKWANAVVLGKNVTKEPGDTVTVDGNTPDALMMLVWIPRYEYKYTNIGSSSSGDMQYGKNGISASSPGEIEINFLTSGTVTPSSNDYKVHPAFTFGSDEISGFWIGKFELSHTALSSNTTLNNLGCTSSSCTSDISKLRILPNVQSLRYNNIANFYYAIKNIENTNLFGLQNIDTHMIKNSEWGAVAYLSQSKYGKYANSEYDNKYKEVYQNKSNTFVTGLSNGSPSKSGYRTGGQCTYNDMTNLGKDNNDYKMGLCGPGASTTGNIYGVYDMSGGTSEYMMGMSIDENITDESGFSSSELFTSGIINSKYYDIYTTVASSSTCNGGVCYGQALSETNNWYDDAGQMLENTYITRITRGGDYSFSRSAGIFNYYNYNSSDTSNYSTRVTFILK